MRAAVVVAPGRVDVVERPRPAPAPGEVLLQTIAAAICASDFHTLYDRDDAAALARWPSDILGHEAVGIVAESRAPGFRPGDLALAVPLLEQGRSFADYQTLPARYVLPLPTGHDPVDLLMAQQLGTVVFAMKEFMPGPPASSAAVLGLGPAGLNFVQLLAHRGVGQIIGADPCSWRAEAGRELGATDVIDPGREDTVDAIAERTGGRGVDLAVEAAGRNLTRRQAMLAAGPRGRVGLFGIPEANDPEVSMPFGEMFRRTPSVHMAVSAQDEPGLASFREARDLIVAGDMKPAALISHHFPLEQLGDAFRAARPPSPGVRKVVIDISALGLAAP